MLARPSFALFAATSMWLGFAAISAGNSGLSREDIAKITAVCRSLVGVEDWRPTEIFARDLRPYIPSQKALAESGVSALADRGAPEIVAADRLFAELG